MILNIMHNTFEILRFNNTGILEQSVINTGSLRILLCPSECKIENASEGFHSNRVHINLIKMVLLRLLLTSNLQLLKENTTISEAGWSKICHSTKLKQRPFNQGNGIPSFKFQQNKMIQLNDRLNMLQITFNKIEDHSSNDAYFEINIFEFLKIG